MNDKFVVTTQIHKRLRQFKEERKANKLLRAELELKLCALTVREKQLDKHEQFCTAIVTGLPMNLKNN